MRIAEFRRSIPCSRDRIPRHEEVALVPAENDVRESHDDVYDGEGEEHEEDVEGDEAEPVEEGFPGAVGAGPGDECAALLVRWGAVGRGCGMRRRKRIAVVAGVRCLWILSMWEVACMRGGRRWAAIAWTVEGSICGFALWAWIRQVAGRDAV